LCLINLQRCCFRTKHPICIHNHSQMWNHDQSIQNSLSLPVSSTSRIGCWESNVWKSKLWAKAYCAKSIFYCNGFQLKSKLWAKAYCAKSIFYCNGFQLRPKIRKPLGAHTWSWAFESLSFARRPWGLTTWLVRRSSRCCRNPEDYSLHGHSFYL
jgi:hypothetical protein